ncbi:MAG: DUF6345 domain-containing protein [Euryarchaeota archaeon]|nr:DUF6345 domain-containing protein [Euryarchaeota archaeon]
MNNRIKRITYGFCVALAVLGAFAGETSALMEGDASGDECTTIGDAMLIAQHTVGMITLDSDQLKSADTTDDGNVDISDAMHIAQYTVDPTGSLSVLFKPLWESPADDGMLKPVPPGVHKYSVTIIEDYSKSRLLNGKPLENLDPWGQEAYDKVRYWLHDQAGWSEEFYENDSDVGETDFGTKNVGYKGLDEADFHYHFGHGCDDIGTELALHNWVPGPNLHDIRAQDVAWKWDQNNEWVLLDSCKILKDHGDWACALERTHAILGYTTVSPVSTELVDEFFREAIDNDATIYEAYLRATRSAFKGDNVTAAVIFDTEDQFHNDRLHGQGTGALPDDHPDEHPYYYQEWVC